MDDFRQFLKEYKWRVIGIAGGILLAMSWCTFAESVALVAAAVVMLARVSVMFIFASIMTALLGLALRVSAKVCRAAGLGRCPAE